MLRETDPLGKVVLRTFDGRNNRLTESIPHAPLPPNAPPAPKTVYEYYPSDDVKSVTDPQGNRTEYTYTARGQVRTVKDPRALAAGYLSTENDYDPVTGNLRWTKDAEGTKTEFTYWADGNVKSQTVKDVNQIVLSTTMYDYLSGVLIRERSLSPTGTELRKTEFVNGIHGVTTRKTWRTTPAGMEELVTTYQYDDNGRLEKAIDPDQTFTRTEYNPAGQQWKAYDKLGRMTESHYDEMGRLWKTTYPDMTTEVSTYRQRGPPPHIPGPEGSHHPVRVRRGRTPPEDVPAGGAGRQRRHRESVRRRRSARANHRRARQGHAVRVLGQREPPEGHRSAEPRDGVRVRRERQPEVGEGREGLHHHVRVRPGESQDEDRLSRLATDICTDDV